MHPPGQPERRHPLHELRTHALGSVLAATLGLLGCAFLVLAAYRGLALWMGPALAAGMLGLALLLLAVLAYLVTHRRSAPPAEGPPESSADPAAQAGEAVADMLRGAGVGSSKLGVASLVAGFVVGMRSGARDREP